MHPGTSETSLMPTIQQRRMQSTTPAGPQKTSETIGTNEQALLRLPLVGTKVWRHSHVLACHTNVTVRDGGLPSSGKKADARTDRQIKIWQRMKYFQILFSIFWEVLLYIITHKRRAVAKFSFRFINVDTGTQNEDP
jgi:hypothetical protein